MKFEIILCCVFCLSIGFGQCLSSNDKDRISVSFKYCTGNLSLLHQKAVNTEFYYKVGETTFKGATILTAAAIGVAAFVTPLPALAYSGIAIGFGGSISCKLLTDRTNIATLNKINVHLDDLIFDIQKIYNFDQSKYNFIIGNISASRKHLIKDGIINLKSEHIVAAYTSILAIVPNIGKLLMNHCGTKEKAHGCLSFLSDLITKNQHKLTEVFSTIEIGFMGIIPIVEIINLHSILTYEADFPKYIQKMNEALKMILKNFIVKL